MKLKLNMISAALIGVAVVGAAAVTTRAQTATPNITAAAPACGCAAEFDSMVQKIETDYIGYRMSLSAMDRGAYDKMKAEVRAAAGRAKDADCFETLLPYVNYFHDGHVFLSEQAELSDGESAKAAAAAETLPWNEQSLRAYLEKNAGKLDPIEGIWYTAAYRIGVVRDRKAGRRDFAAVMLSDGVKNWKPGQVKADIRELPDGGYKGLFYFGDHSTHHLEGHIYKGLLLDMPPVTWGKEFPIRDFDAGLLNAKDPSAPTLKVLAGGAVLVSMPSHSPDYAEPLNALIAAHDVELRAASLVIVDIRGDEGGSSQTSDGLAPFYYTENQKPEMGPGGHPVVLSSPDQIKYFEAMAKQADPASDWGKMLASLVGRLKENPGKVIPMSEKGDPYSPTEKPANLSAAPKHFAILTDRADMSAAEAFVLEARKYDRVTQFGENTGGTIDYQNIQMVPLECKTHGYWIGFPTIGGSDLLPKGGFNGVGIPPDVRIEKDVKDWVRFVVEYYLKGEKN